MLAIALAAALAQAEPITTEAAPGPGVLVHGPRWLHRPDGRDVGRVYPYAARRSGTPGAVLLECGVEATGLLSNCRVLTERPEGQGFGSAALKLVPEFRLAPTLDDGRPVAGGTVRIPMAFGPAR